VDTLLGPEITRADCGRSFLLRPFRWCGGVSAGSFHITSAVSFSSGFSSGMVVVLVVSLGWVLVVV